MQAITHTTLEGKVMLIQDMDDKHLINTARLLLKKATMLRQTRLSEDMDEFTRGFIDDEDIHEMNEREAGREAGELYRKACMYIAELYYRQVNCHELRILMEAVAPKRNQRAIEAAPTAGVSAIDDEIQLD